MPKPSSQVPVAYLGGNRQVGLCCRKRKLCQLPIYNGISSTEVQLPAVLAPWPYMRDFHVTKRKFQS